MLAENCGECQPCFGERRGARPCGINDVAESVRAPTTPFAQAQGRATEPRTNDTRHHLHYNFPTSAQWPGR
jgi:hypothetical protein